MPNIGFDRYEESVDHMIIWLDLHIAVPTQCIHLKKAFSTMPDPKNETPQALFDRDAQYVVNKPIPQPVHFEGVWFLLAAFTDIDRCIDCINANQEKRIFLITSGSLGAIAVPRILNEFPHVFTDPLTDQPYASIYVFCADPALHLNWVDQYLDYIQAFNFEADLLSRMVRDIANYFKIEGRRLMLQQPPDVYGAYHRLNWAHLLYQRYEKMEDYSMQSELNTLNPWIEELEEEMRSSSEEESTDEEDK